MHVAGVDGTKGGWIAVELADGRFSAARLLSPVGTRFDELASAAVVAIDIPIGFGPRRADPLARALLRGAASTVFTTPSRELLEQPFRPGLGISAQAHALGPRIVHVTSLASRDPRFHEAHPELSFLAMNGGEPLRYRKKSAGGVTKRIELLRTCGIELGDLADAASAPVDDVLDAAACAWTAHRIAAGAAHSLPDPPQAIDGLPVAIWY